MQMKEQELEKESLMEKKKRLEEIRAFHQPLDRGDMMDYALKHDEVLRQRKEEIK